MAIYDGAFYDVISTGTISLPTAIVTPSYVSGTIYDGVFIENTEVVALGAAATGTTPPTGSTGSVAVSGCGNFAQTSVQFQNNYTISLMSSSLSQYGFVGPCTASMAPFSMGTRTLIGMRTLAKAPYVAISGRYNSSGTLFPLGTQ